MANDADASAVRKSHARGADLAVDLCGFERDHACLPGCVIAPDRPRLVPLTIAILVCCPLFSSEAGRALLDIIGLAFFTTLVILFAQLARKHPAWTRFFSFTGISGFRSEN
jgi:hypothetical protein